MKGAFEEADVSEPLQQAGSLGVAFEPAALVHEKHERKVGPIGLVCDPCLERAGVGTDQRLRGDNR